MPPATSFATPTTACRGFSMRARHDDFWPRCGNGWPGSDWSFTPDKTRLIRFGRFAAQQSREQGIRKPQTFDFPGFTHCCSKRRSNGDFLIVRLTIKKRMRATLVANRETLMRRRHEPVPVVGPWLRRVLLSLAEIFGFDPPGCRPLNLFCSPFIHDADPVVWVANLDVRAGVQQIAAVAVQYKAFVLNVQLPAGFTDRLDDILVVGRDDRALVGLAGRGCA
nr:hypothetical protein [Paraburkholderia humisilvae]